VIFTAALRHVVTLYPGAIVGEIALVSGGDSTRTATVRAGSEGAELLVLDTTSFNDLDPDTISIIGEAARYRAACTKNPDERTNDDLMVLMNRTAHLHLLAGRGERVHYELCRNMVYTQLGADTLLVAKGQRVHSVNVLLSGSANAYNAEPRGAGRAARRGARNSRDEDESLAAGAVSGAPLLSVATAFADTAPKASHLGIFRQAGIGPVMVLREGDAIGEAEMLEEGRLAARTVVTTEAVEVIELHRDVFNRVLRDDLASERGRRIRFLQSLPPLAHVPMPDVHGIAASLLLTTIERLSLCLAYPADASLGASSYSPAHVYLIYTGEARLMAAPV